MRLLEQRHRPIAWTGAQRSGIAFQESRHTVRCYFKCLLVPANALLQAARKLLLAATSAAREANGGRRLDSRFSCVLVFRVMDAIADAEERHLGFSAPALGRRIAMRRNQTGRSQRQLARETDIASSRLSRIEWGRCKVQLVELVRLCETLRLDLDELVFGRALSQSRLERLARLLEEVGDPAEVDVIERLLGCLIDGKRKPPESCS